ncbi:MAG TPA: hypothetical protein PK404_05615 [Fervidobacterium sp.]|mgnify:CR=1 FL=1|nr:hypothetical protein [Fervidobacterium sp.]HOM74709.1 hypothetical protein [Fervidobacterium sp.]HPP18267.1 hypothetical protein [Fervidobacterium sp.]
MAISKRTTVLLVVLVVVWAVAIFVLMKMNSPKPAVTTVQPVQQSTDIGQSGMGAMNGTQSANISLSDLQNLLPEVSFTDLFRPYVVSIPYELLETDVIEDISSPQFKYVGYISFLERGKEEKKVFIQSGDQFVSASENDLIESRYKPVIITSTYLVILDTQDGRIKKISYVGS